MKWCPQCRQVKPVDEFYRDKTQNRPTSWCKTCTKAKNIVYYANNTEKAKAAHKQWALKNRELVILQKTSSALKVKVEVLRALPKVCVICGATKALCFDH